MHERRALIYIQMKKTLCGRRERQTRFTPSGRRRYKGACLNPGTRRRSRGPSREGRAEEKYQCQGWVPYISPITIKIYKRECYLRQIDTDGLNSTQSLTIFQFFCKCNIKQIIQKEVLDINWKVFLSRLYKKDLKIFHLFTGPIHVCSYP